MSKLLCPIVKIEELNPIQGADRIVLAKVLGWYCIVGKNQFAIGQMAIFLPPDSIVPDKLIEQYKLEFLKKNNRVGTIKLKGVISQGLILTLDCLPTNKRYKVGDNVAEDLGIQKYEPPEPVYQQHKKETIKEYWIKLINKEITLRRFVAKSIGIIKDNLRPKKKTNKAFDCYTDINNIKHYIDLFKEGEPVIITEKIHGCLNANTKILLFDGTSKKIKEIVDNKLNVLLASRNINGQIIPSRIIKWFHNGYTKQWRKITFTRKNLAGNKFGKIICTPYHRFLKVIDDEWYEAQTLKKDDEIYVSQRIYDIPNLIKDVLIGKMLGDGSYDKKHYSISFGHKKEPFEYVNFTLKYLGFMAGNLQKDRISGYGTIMCRARTKSDKSITRIFDCWYSRTGNKQVPPIKLSPISLAFWYMDDGSLSHHYTQKDRANFAVCGFDEISVDNLLIALNDLGLKGEKYFSENKYWRIRLNTESAYKMFYMIAPYIPNCMRYKLPEELRNLSINPIIEYKEPLYKQVLTVQKILKIEDYNCQSDSQSKYDLETENHNYIANGVVVHNSNSRFAYLTIPTTTLIGQFKRKFLKQTYEFVYGSHRVQLFGKYRKTSFYGEDVYGQIAKKYDMANKLTAYPDLIFYGEIYGDKIQELTYGLKGKIDLVIFDIKDVKTGKYLNYKQVNEICCKLELPQVPVLFIGGFSLEVLKECTTGTSILESQNYIKKPITGDIKTIEAGLPCQIREGCVVKPVEEVIDPRLGRKILKSISEEYLLSKTRTEFH